MVIRIASRPQTARTSERNSLDARAATPGRLYILRHRHATSDCAPLSHRATLRHRGMRSKPAFAGTTLGRRRFVPTHRPCSRRKTKRHPAKLERIARHRAPSCLGGIEHLGDIADLKRQPAHDLAVALDETEDAIRQFQFRLRRLRILADGNLEDPVPSARRDPADPGSASPRRSRPASRPCGSISASRDRPADRAPEYRRCRRYG